MLTENPLAYSERTIFPSGYAMDDVENSATNSTVQEAEQTVQNEEKIVAMEKLKGWLSFLMLNKKKGYYIEKEKIIEILSWCKNNG